MIVATPKYASQAANRARQIDTAVEPATDLRLRHGFHSSPAELTGPRTRDLDAENVGFTWNTGTFVKSYQLTVDINPGGAMPGNFGPGTGTSASVRMPPPESPIYVTLFFVTEYGGGLALS